jgi:hypothetical protein
LSIVVPSSIPIGPFNLKVIKELKDKNNVVTPAGYDTIIVKILAPLKFDFWEQDGPTYAPIIIIMLMTGFAVIPTTYSRLSGLQRSHNWGLNISTVVQTDAALIAGVLLFLGLSSTIKIYQFPLAQSSHLAFVALTAEIVFPFAASAIVSVIESRPKTQNGPKKEPKDSVSDRISPKDTKCLE